MAPKPRSECRTVEERVNHVAEMMADGSYVGGYAIRCELAEAWGVSESTVRNYASEAHRLVCFDEEDRKHLRRANAARMLKIANAAETTFNVMTGMPDFKAQMDALDRFAKYAGVDLDAKPEPEKAAPIKIEIVYAKDVSSADRSEQVPSADAGTPAPKTG